MSNARIMRDALRQRYGNKPLGALLKAHADEFNDGSFNVRGLFPSLYEESFVAAERRYWQEFDILNQSTAFWRASDYSGSGVVADGSGNAHDLTNNGATFLAYSGEPYVYLPGALGNTISTPDAADFDGAGNLDVRLYDITIDDLTPAINSVLIGREGSTWHLRLNTTGILATRFYVGGVAKFTVATTSLGAAGEADGVQIEGLRWFHNVTTGISEFFVMQDGSWVSLGGGTTTVGAIDGSAQGISLGGDASGLAFRELRLREAEVYNGTSLVASWSAADMNQTGGTSGGRTWTINRAASGRKSVLVDRPLFLLGTDDYLSTPDAADLDVGVADDFTAIVVARAFGSATGFVGILTKRTTNNLTAPGWSIYTNNDTSLLASSISDSLGNGSFGQNLDIESKAYGYAVRRDVAADRHQTVSVTEAGATLLGSSVDNTTASLANSALLTVGGNNGTGAAHMEFMGAAVFRRALTDAEIALVGQALGSD